MTKILLAAAVWAALLIAKSPVDRVNRTPGGVAAKGYDVVAYFEDGRPVKGSSRFTYEWMGANWQFSTGERRDRDLGGRPVSAQATFPDGSAGTGLGGLRRYLAQERQDEFLDNLCRKLLAYALSRSLLLSDDRTIQNMRARLAADGYRFDSLIEQVVTSPQFLNKRGKDDLRE